MSSVVVPKGKVLKGYKFLLKPTKEQAEFLDKCINVNRYVYNWALELEKEQYKLYQDGKSKSNMLSRNDLDLLFTKMRQQNTFVNDVPHNTGRSAIRRVVHGYKMAFKTRNKFPKFKSKKNKRGMSYITRADRMYIDGNKLQIEGVPERFININFDTGMKRNDRKFYCTVVSRDVRGKYYIGFKVLEDKKSSKDLELEGFEVLQNKAIGIDLNKENRIVLSTGEAFKAPDISKEKKKLARLQRKLQKDRDRHKEQERTNPDEHIGYSNRHKNRVNKFRKYNEDIHNKNINFVNVSCKRIIQHNPELGFVIENISIQEMIEGDRRMSKNMAFSCFGYIQDRLKELTCYYNIPLLVADRYYPSSQLCSCCGNRQKIGSKRTYICPNCGNVMDRDLNAAKNLEALAYQ